MIRRSRRFLTITAVLALLSAACSAGPVETDPATADAPATTALGAEPVTTEGSAGSGASTTMPGAEGTPGPTTGPTTTLPPLLGLELELLAEGFAQPTVLASPPGDERIFIGERQGVIHIYDPDVGLLDEPFMSIPDRVASNGIEQGLLGMAFHPDYASNGRFFLYHTDRDQQRQLAEYQVRDDNPNKANLDSGVALWDRAQPEGSTDIRHYAGDLEFGPDGYLYISSGDGAAGSRTGQSKDDYFGAILRIDVDSGEGYSAPPDNPYVDGGGDPAVWAIGLRNPWRLAIDGNKMFIADVGQADLEEINVVSLDDGGVNFGWATMEGTECFIPSDCDPTGLTLPIYEYTHSEGCSITGGHVYRGQLIPELQGHYFFADWCEGWVRSLLYEDGAVQKVRNWSADLVEAGSVNAFHRDLDGELYLVNHEGKFFAILPVR